MTQDWIYSLISVIIVSLMSLVGVITFSIKLDTLKRVLFILVSFAAGSLFGGAFLHLLPEAIEQYGLQSGIFLILIGGIMLFFILEKIIHWRHCHIPTSDKHPHPLAFMNLIGDGVHNFIDGLAIGGSYLVSFQLGLATTIAVVLHEIPQEMGDFGILIYAGMSRAKALFFNFLSALSAVLGTIAILVFGPKIHHLSFFILPFTAGGFIYIAGSDLIPELRKENIFSKSFLQLLAILFGVALMMLLGSHE
jgi:zinc and cadmium transporter